MKAFALTVLLFVFPLYVRADAWREMAIERIGPSAAPEFTLPNTEGKKFALKDFKGRYVLLNFWATWCPPCVEEMPSLGRLNSVYGKNGLSVVAINDYESKEKAAKFIKRNDIGFLVLVDPSGKVSESYRATVLPTTFIIDRDGRAIGKAMGMRDWASPAAMRFFNDLLNGK
jgi:peroxiredoxin